MYMMSLPSTEKETIMQGMGMTRCLISAFLATSMLACNTDSSNTDDEKQPRKKDTESDSDSAEVTDSDSSSIWVTPPYDAPDADHPYHACDEATATGEATDISDFDDGTLSVLPNEHRGGFWGYSNDGTGGQLTVEVDDGALHATSSGWSLWGASVGVLVAPSLSDTEHCYYDASCYAGVRFRAKGSGTFKFQLAGFDNFPVAYGGACDKPGEACYDWPQKSGTLSDEWQTFEFSYCELRAEGWGGRDGAARSKGTDWNLLDVAGRTIKRDMVGRSGILHGGRRHRPRGLRRGHLSHGPGPPSGDGDP